MKQFGEKRLQWKVDKLVKKVTSFESLYREIIELASEVKDEADHVEYSRDDYIASKTKKIIEKLEKRIEELEGGPKIEADQVALARAKTFAIVDSILFAIENWSFDESPAPDITLASQATLFPILLQKVSKGDEDYYMEEVPHAAAEVVRRGREFVRSFREDESITVLDPLGWAVLQPVLHKWWTRDAMPLLYGASDPGWVNEEPFTLEQMNTWRTMEMSRAIDFPLIFDGFELVKKYGDEIRVESGLPEFSKSIMQTRIRTND